MNWDDIKLFLAIARSKSISGAAQNLKVQHSTVSRRLHKLENTVGSRLFDRKRSGLTLTEAGYQVYDSALKMEAEAINIDSQLHFKDRDCEGQLVVAVLNDMASGILMPIFARFIKQYPKVQLHIKGSSSTASLAQREADVAIRLTNTPVDTLIGKRILTVSSTVYGQKQYLQNQKKALLEPEWLGAECCHYHRNWTSQSCDVSTHQLYSDDSNITLSAIKAGLGISYLPCYMGDDDPELQRVCEPQEKHDLGLWLLIHPDLKHSSRVRTFREYMVEGIEKERGCFEGEKIAIGFSAIGL